MRKKNSWINILKSKIELAQKQYEIIAMGISIAKIDLEKTEKTKEKIGM